MYRFFLAASSFTPLSGAAVITNLFQLFAHLVLLKWPFPPLFTYPSLLQVAGPAVLLSLRA